MSISWHCPSKSTAGCSENILNIDANRYRIYYFRYVEIAIKTVWSDPSQKWKKGPDPLNLGPDHCWIQSHRGQVKNYSGEEKILIVLGWPEPQRHNKNLFYRHDKSNEPTKEGPYHMYSLSSHSPQTVGRGNPSRLSGWNTFSQTSLATIINKYGTLYK